MPFYPTKHVGHQTQIAVQNLQLCIRIKNILGHPDIPSEEPTIVILSHIGRNARAQIETVLQIEHDGLLSGRMQGFVQGTPQQPGAAKQKIASGAKGRHAPSPGTREAERLRSWLASWFP